jgi:peptidoglycan/LPS O-acetylase OafA/YrhL
MSQIDGLRAFAVLSVLFAHYWMPGTEIGHIGVRLFFVVSGFLITSILLRSRQQVEKGDASVGQAFFRFYSRRVLRIVPAYYVLLAIMAAWNPENFRGVMHWHLAFSSNILFAIREEYVPWMTAHLWSLSVEEQFYLIWPWLVLMVPRRRLVLVIALVGLAGLAYRVLGLVLGMPDFPRFFLAPASFDALAAGALLALVRDREVVWRWFGWTCIPAAAWLLAIETGLVRIETLFTIEIWLGTFLLLPLVAIVARASYGFTGPFAAVLMSRPAQYVGRISFGIYLYRLLVLAVIMKIGERTGIPVEHGPLLFVVASTATLLVATLSWYVVETPFNRLKRRIPHHAGFAKDDAPPLPQTQA